MNEQYSTGMMLYSSSPKIIFVSCFVDYIEFLITVTKNYPVLLCRMAGKTSTSLSSVSTAPRLLILPILQPPSQNGTSTKVFQMILLLSSHSQSFVFSDLFLIPQYAAEAKAFVYFFSFGGMSSKTLNILSFQVTFLIVPNNHNSSHIAY